MTLLEDFGKALLNLKVALENNNYRSEFKIVISSEIMLRLLSDSEPYELVYEETSRYNPLRYSLFGIEIESPRLDGQYKYPVLKDKTYKIVEPTKP